MAKRRGPAPNWSREHFEGVPGAPEVSTWHVPPRMPLRITETGAWRDGGTGMMTVVDADNRRWTFCFDKFLGRLCTGAHPDDDDAAFVRVGSQLEADLFAVMAETVQRITYRLTPDPFLTTAGRPHRSRPAAAVLRTSPRALRPPPATGRHRRLPPRGTSPCPKLHLDRCPTTSSTTSCSSCDGSPSTNWISGKRWRFDTPYGEVFVHITRQPCLGGMPEAYDKLTYPHT